MHGRLCLTLRAGNEKGTHAHSYNEALSPPDGTKVTKSRGITGMNDREDEQAKRDEEGAKTDHSTEIAGIQKPSDGVGEKENQKRLC